MERNETSSSSSSCGSGFTMGVVEGVSSTHDNNEDDKEEGVEDIDVRSDEPLRRCAFFLLDFFSSPGKGRVVAGVEVWGTGLFPSCCSAC